MSGTVSVCPFTATLADGGPMCLQTSSVDRREDPTANAPKPDVAAALAARALRRPRRLMAICYSLFRPPLSLKSPSYLAVSRQPSVLTRV